MTRWHAILLAGKRPGEDPFARQFGLDWKALIPIAGQPMVAHCLSNLLAVDAIAKITLLTQEPEALMAHPDLRRFGGDARLEAKRSGSGIASSIIDAAQSPGAEWPILVTTADHVLLTPETIAQFLTRAGGADVSMGVVERRTVLAAYPENRRTWLHFKGGSWTGANLFALNGAGALKALAVWADVEQHRKKGWRLIARFGPWLLIRALTRTISLERAMAVAGKRLGFSARPVALTDPLAAIDVDKILDHALAEAVLAEKK